MRLFNKNNCPICGEKQGGTSFCLSDGEKICAACEKLLRGSRGLAEWNDTFSDTSNTLDLFHAKRIVDGLKAEQREMILRFVHVYGGILSVLSVFPLHSDQLMESGSEASALSGKPVALGFCAYGVFGQGERVRIIGDERETETTILKLIPCTGAYTFYEEMLAGTHKTECSENCHAWVILDSDFEDIAINDKIAACPIRPR